MIGTADGVLSTLFDVVLTALWGAIAAMALLWLGMIAAFFWSAGKLLFPRSGRLRRASETDLEFLRSIHIRP